MSSFDKRDLIVTLGRMDDEQVKHIVQKSKVGKSGGSFVVYIPLSCVFDAMKIGETHRST